MARRVVVFDACVLYPAPLRDLLMRVVVIGLVEARWTQAIHEEWTRSVLRDRPDLDASRLARTRALMDLHAPGSIVTNYAHLAAGVTLPDPDDRHVVAAALASGANEIVTVNVRDFPKSALDPFGITSIHPDAFLLSLLEESPARMIRAVSAQYHALRHPPLSPARFLEVLEKQGLTGFTEALRHFAPEWIGD